MAVANRMGSERKEYCSLSIRQSSIPDTSGIMTSRITKSILGCRAIWAKASLADKADSRL
ncbi:hypothetical protein D3C81_2310760 [compost metagenome]